MLRIYGWLPDSQIFLECKMGRFEAYTLQYTERSLDALQNITIPVTYCIQKYIPYRVVSWYIILSLQFDY